MVAPASSGSTRLNLFPTTLPPPLRCRNTLVGPCRRGCPPWRATTGPQSWMLLPCPRELRNGGLPARFDTTFWGFNGVARESVRPWKFESAPRKVSSPFKMSHHPQPATAPFGLTIGVHLGPGPSRSAFAPSPQMSPREGSIPATTTALWTLRKSERIPRVVGQTPDPFPWGRRRYPGGSKRSCEHIHELFHDRKAKITLICFRL